MTTFHKLTILLAGLILLIACQEEVLPEKNFTPLQQTQLNSDLSSFQEKLEENRTEMKRKIQNLNSLDRSWLASFHFRYPDPQIALARASQHELNRYRSLSSQNLHSLDEESTRSLESVIIKLKQSGVFSPMDLSKYLYPYPESMEANKIDLSCELMCELKGQNYQRSLFSSCMEGNDSEVACAKDAEIHYRYFMIECMEGCK